MTGSVIQLPGEPNPLDPSTGYQFVIEPGERGWYHTDGLPYWLSAFQVAQISARNFNLTQEPMLKNFKYHFATEFPTYPSSQPTKTGDKTVFGWDTNEFVAKMKEKHLFNFQTLGDKIDVTFEETNDPNQHGVMNVIRADFIQAGGAPLPIYLNTPGNYDSYDLFMGYSDAYLDSLPVGAFRDSFHAGYSHNATHELGHALGLDHPFFKLKLPGFEDNIEFSQMSYTNMTTNPYGSWDSDAFVDFTEMDTAALQWLYGPSLKVRTGNDTYVLDASKPNWLWDGVGVDTIDASSLNAPLTISLQPGYWGYIGAQRGYGITAPGSVTVNYGSTFENITGSAFNDTFTGNAANNRLDGGAGIDTVVFTHARASYNLARQSNGTWTAQDTSTNTWTQPKLVQEWYEISFGNYDFRWAGQADAPFDGNDGTDTLVGVERLKFKDHSVALDLGAGQAGEQAARLIGAVAGKALLAEKTVTGAVLGLLDSGMSTQSISQMIVSQGLLANLAGGADNTSALKFIFNNVIGRTATATEVAALLPLVEEYGQAWLISAASDLPQTSTQIDLMGLSGSGLAFI